jgi:hypothetical protein
LHSRQTTRERKERKKELSKKKKKRERKKELQWALGNGVEWTANDKEEMAVVESQRCEQLRVTVSGFGF